jgi:hypothetical protein
VRTARAAAQRAGAQPPEELSRVEDRLEQLQARLHSFAEIRALRDFYHGRLTLTEDEARELLRVTGEHGDSHAARLGLADETPAAELAREASRLAARWAVRFETPLLDHRTREAARTVRRSYEHLFDKIRAGDQGTGS